MIPDFQSLMLPFLKFASDEKEHSTKEVAAYLADMLKLSREELEQMLPSGTQTTFANRVHWAKAYLKMANLIENTRHGYFKISPAGFEILKKNLSVINIALLKTIPGFKEKTSPPVKRKSEASEPETEADLTPEENIERSSQNIKTQLTQDLLQKIMDMSPAFFEKLVVELLVKMGYGGSIKDAGQVVGKKGDEGIDGVIKEDKLGLDNIYIQAKRWKNVVGSPEIKNFVGALAGQGAKKGVFITTSSFTSDAKKFIDKVDAKIVLINGEELAQYMIDYDLGVSTVSTYQIKRIDLDYFGEE